MNILIMPCQRILKDGSRNPREYPFWSAVAMLFRTDNHPVTIQYDMIPYDELKSKLSQYDLVVTIDSFIQHFCWYHGIRCAVVWGPSEWRIFGHKEHLNITDSNYRPRPDQFNIWEGCTYDPSLFPSPEHVVKSILINMQSQR